MENYTIKETNYLKLPIKSEVKCTKCKKIKTKIRYPKKTKRWLFKDENGKLWDAGVCPLCKLRRSCKPRDEVENPRYKTGRKSEITAKKYFESLGYEVDLVNVTGPDLTIRKNGIVKTVEVKTVSKDKRKRGRNYAVAAVWKTRVNDDMIAYVLGEQVVVREMKDHLKEVGISGDLVVTRFFRNEKDVQNLRKSKLTGFKGVTLREKLRYKPYYAFISINGKQKYIGYFNTAEEAAKAYDIEAIKHFGEFASLNFPDIETTWPF